MTTHQWMVGTLLVGLAAAGPVLAAEHGGTAMPAKEHGGAGLKEQASMTDVEALKMAASKLRATDSALAAKLEAMAAAHMAKEHGGGAMKAKEHKEHGGT